MKYTFISMTYEIAGVRDPYFQSLFRNTGQYKDCCIKTKAKIQFRFHAKSKEADLRFSALSALTNHGLQ